MTACHQLTTSASTLSLTDHMAVASEDGVGTLRSMFQSFAWGSFVPEKIMLLSCLMRTVVFVKVASQSWSLQSSEMDRRLLLRSVSSKRWAVMYLPGR